MPTMFVVSILLNLGMYVERWMIVAPTLTLAHNPHQWDVLWGSVIQWAIVFGSFGWFGLLFLIFVKLFPCVSMYEVKELCFHLKHEIHEEEMAKKHAASKAAEKADEGAGGKAPGTPGLEGA